MGTHLLHDVGAIREVTRRGDADERDKLTGPTGFVGEARERVPALFGDVGLLGVAGQRRQPGGLAGLRVTQPHDEVASPLIRLRQLGRRRAEASARPGQLRLGRLQSADGRGGLLREVGQIVTSGGELRLDPCPSITRVGRASLRSAPGVGPEQGEREDRGGRREASAEAPSTGVDRCVHGSRRYGRAGSEPGRHHRT